MIVWIEERREISLSKTIIVGWIIAFCACADTTNNRLRAKTSIVCDCARIKIDFVDLGGDGVKGRATMIKTVQHTSTLNYYTIRLSQFAVREQCAANLINFLYKLFLII